MDRLILKVLCLVTMVILASHTANGQVPKKVKEAVKSGLKAGHALAEVLSEGNFDESLAKLATNLKPYLGALGPLAGIALALIPSGDSKELAYMKKEFEKVNTKLDRLNLKVDKVLRAIDWSKIEVSYGVYERNIEAAEVNLNRIYKVGNETRESHRQYFIKNYDSHFDNSAENLYNGAMNNDRIFTKNILWAAIKQTKYHKEKVKRFSVRLIQLLVRGIKVEISYRAMKGWKTEFSVNEWNGKMEKLRRRLKAIIAEVKSVYKSQAKKDVEEYLTEHYQKGNKALVQEIYDFLNEKYDWRDWFVAVYDDVWGFDRHAIGHCGGFSLLHFKNKKNVVVVNKDKTPSSLKAADAKKLLEDLKADINGCSRATRDPGDRARTIRNLIAKKSGNGCRPYALELVVETGRGLWYISPYSRTFYAKIDKWIDCEWYTKGWWIKDDRHTRSVRWSLNVLLFG